MPALRGSTTMIYGSRVVPAGQYHASKDSVDIFITDMAFHSQKHSNPNSLVRNYTKHLNGGKPRRTYGSVKALDNGQIEMAMNFDEQEVLDLLAKTGKSKLRIYMPAVSMPGYIAEDALEKLESLKRKHLLQVDPRRK